MDNRLLLVKSISLLFRESLIENKSENSADLVRTVLENITVTDDNLTINHDRDITIALKQTAIEMCDNSKDFEYDKILLLQTLKMNCGNDDKLYENFIQNIEPDLQEASIKKSIINLKKSIHNHFREQKVSEVLNKAAAEFKFRRSNIKNINQFIAETIAQLEPFQMDAITRDPAIISEVDISDENAVQGIFKEIKQNYNGEGILKTGYQQLNVMLQGGFRRGDLALIGALQHKYKTGFTLSLFKQIALYNTPTLIDPTKKPLLLRISFEDDINLNMQFLYQSLKENETGQKVVLANVSEDEISSYVKERMQATGFHVKMLRVDPTKWGYINICNKILELEAEGYEIALLMLDYLAMVPTTGCSIGGPMGTDIRDMFRRMRNFCNPRKITLITPHQLSSEAKQLIRDGRQDFVKEIAEKGYFDKCRSLDQELDLELYIHIEKLNKKSYLTVQRGKHRIPTIIPDEQKYFVLPFQDIGGVRDDINGQNTAMKKIGGGHIGGGDENPWWDGNGMV